MNPFQWYIDFITNNENKISHKLTVTVCTIFIVLFLDNTLGFSFGYKINQKIEMLERVDLIIQNPKSDSISISYAKYLRDRIIYRESWVDYLRFRRYSSNSKSENSINPATSPNKLSIRNEFLYLMSAGGLFILLGIFAPPLILFTQKTSQIFNRIGYSIMAFCALVGFGLSLSSIFDIIPLIGNNWRYNYVVNSVLQLGIIYGISELYFYLLNRELDKREKVLKEQIEKLKELETKVESLKGKEES